MKLQEEVFGKLMKDNQNKIVFNAIHKASEVQSLVKMYRKRPVLNTFSLASEEATFSLVSNTIMVGNLNDTSLQSLQKFVTSTDN